MDVSNKELDRRTTRTFAKPHKEILLFVLLEEQEVVAGQLMA